MNQRITVIINKGTSEEQSFSLDSRIINFGVEILHGDHSDIYELPREAATTVYPFEVLQAFIEAHQYNPGNVQVRLPLKTNKYQEIVDAVTYQCLSKFTDLKFIEQANAIISLAKFLNFTLFYNAIGAALATNFFVGEDEKDINAFMQESKIEKLSTEQIGQIIDENRLYFEKIQQKMKEQHLFKE